MAPTGAWRAAGSVLLVFVAAAALGAALLHSTTLSPLPSPMWSYTTGTTRVGCDRLGTHAGRQLPDTVDVRVHLEQILQGWVKGVKRGRSMGAQKLYDGFAKSMAAPIYMNLGISSGPCHASIVGLRTMGNVGSACTDSLGDVELDLPTPFEQEDNKGELFLPSLQKYARQLYYFTASHGLPSGALRGTDVLEVGCGRGRGGIYVAQTFEPNRYVGMDLSQGNVDIATSHYGHIPNAQFIQGNADSMSFKNTEFDVVLSVESSHNYPSFERFIAEVYRVLKPGGRLLWVDVILGGTSNQRVFENTCARRASRWSSGSTLGNTCWRRD